MKGFTMTSASQTVSISVLKRPSPAEIGVQVEMPAEDLLRGLVEQPEEVVSILMEKVSPVTRGDLTALVAELASFAPAVGDDEAETKRKDAGRKPIKARLPAWVPGSFKEPWRDANNFVARQIIGLDADAVPGATWDDVVATIRAKLPGLFVALHTTATERNADGTWCVRPYVVLDEPVRSKEEWNNRIKPWMRRFGVQDDNALDCVRFFYLPIRTAGYRFAVIEGARLCLADLPAPAAAESGPRLVASPALAPTPRASPPEARRKAAALVLGSNWAPAGKRHAAKITVGGALMHSGWSKEETIAFGFEIYAHVAQADSRTFATREDLERLYNNTIARDFGASFNSTEKQITGWPTLERGELIDAAVVKAAKDLLHFERVNAKEAEADFNRRVEERIGATRTGGRYKPNGNVVTAGPFEFYTGGLDTPVPELTWQIDTLITASEVVMLVAHGGSLKTWLAFSLALAVATGRPWLGRYPVKRGRVAILDFESGNHERDRRLQMLGIKDAETSGWLLRCSYPDAKMLDPETWISLAGLNLEFLIIDSFNAASPADVNENDATASELLKLAGRFAELTGCTVVIIHHRRKGSAGDAREAVRGNTAIFAACDRIFEFDELEKRDGGIVVSTMSSLKEGPGPRPADVRVELSDAGLRWLDLEPKPAEDTEQTAEARIRAEALGILNQTDIPKQELIDQLHGKTDARKRVVAKLLTDGVALEYRESGKGRKAWLRRNPSVAA